MAETLTPETIARIIDLVPDAWLADGDDAVDVDRMREAYRRYLVDRRSSSQQFVEEALGAR
jgi:hypothetical protein